jgi:hypothetical protein
MKMNEQEFLKNEILNEVLNCISQKNPDAEKCTQYIIEIISKLHKPIEPITLTSEPWPPAPNVTTTAGITTSFHPSEKSGEADTLLVEALNYLQKLQRGYTLRDIDAMQTDASKTLDALIQRIQKYTKMTWEFPRSSGHESIIYGFNDTQHIRPVVKVETAKAKSPHKCPVCEGRGNVLYGFYLDRETQSTDARLTEPCRQCGGTGII